MKLAGGCRCGALRYQVDGDLGPVANCHCAFCRRIHGAPFTTISPPVAARAAGGDEDDGGSPVVFVVIGLVVLVGVVLAVTLRRRRKRADEPVEIEV